MTKKKQFRPAVIVSVLVMMLCITGCAINTSFDSEKTDKVEYSKDDEGNKKENKNDKDIVDKKDESQVNDGDDKVDETEESTGSTSVDENESKENKDDTAKKEDISNNSSSFNGEYLKDTSVDNPAKLGEWVEAYRYNATTSKYDIVYVRITGVERNQDKVEAAKDEYLDKHSYVTFDKPEISDLEWCYAEYDVYFPTDWEAPDYGISSTDFKLGICNNDGKNKIKDVIGLSTTWEIGDTSDDKIFPGDTYHGKALFLMFSDYNDFLVTSNTYVDDTKYVWYFDIK